jgi:PEP-CTERM motif
MMAKPSEEKTAEVLVNCGGKTRGLRRQLLVLSFLAIGIAVFSSTANASILSLGACPAANPGDTTIPCLANGIPAGTLLASIVAPFTNSTGTDSGTVVSAVYRESGGTEDFYYQIANNRTSTNCGATNQPACDAISRETDRDFSTWLTQLAYRSDGSSLAGGLFVNGTVNPVTGDRNSAGDVIGFSFSPLILPPIGSYIEPGTTSNVFIISTNATLFREGSATVINVDGTMTTVPSFEPPLGTPVPEPASMALLGSGLLALSGLRRRIKTRRGI